MGDLPNDQRDQLREWSLSRAQGEYRLKCPACSDARSAKNKGQKTLSVRIEDERTVYHCWHCNVQGAVRTVRGAPPILKTRKPVRAKPIPAPPQVISKPHQDWLANRGLSLQVCERYGLRSEDRALAFPYGYSGAHITGLKYRAIDSTQHIEGQAKTMWSSGAFPTPFGWAQLSPDHEVCHLFEGEIDCLTGATLGLANCLSVPTGASLGETNPPWLNALFEWASAHGSVIRLCADDDSPGQGFIEKFIEAAEKADARYAVNPSYFGHKDLNAAYLAGDGSKCRDQIDSIEEPPVKGIAKASDNLGGILDIYRGNVGQKHSTGFPSLDEYFSLPLGYMTVLTGYPNMGKSSFLDQILVNAADLHGFHTVIWSPENGAQMHPTRLLEIKLGLPFFEPEGKDLFRGIPRMREEDIEASIPWLDKHFTWLDDTEEASTIESILSRMGRVIDRTGAKVCVLDPYNNVEKPTHTEQETEWIRRLTVKCRTFARKRKVHFFLVAHPKQQPQAMKDHVPKGESISGGANWRAVADFGLTVHRHTEEGQDFPSPYTTVYVWKVRHKHHGKLGKAVFSFDSSNSRYKDHR